GLFIIFKPRRKYSEHRWKKWQHRRELHRNYQNYRHNRSWCQPEPDNTEMLDCTVFMGGTKKNILNKNFKGGEVVAVFGGTEINFLQADFENTVTL
ncbi:hypothetical protein NK983_27200, partial [Salmonella enterica subsp. enterica serovar Typhimurium]|nr:hypothetical protein [Salmonella enterica subsp. enterica serovar Typhimurium]